MELSSNWLKNKKGFLIGAGGSGMSSLGHILLDFGIELYGVDSKKSTSLSKLEQKGFKSIKDIKNITNIDFAVYSSAINKTSNEYYQYFKSNQIPLYHRSQIMHAIFRSLKSISVAGSHGKTSTTTMIAQILLQSNFNPTIMIGGETSILDGTGGTFSNGEWGVYESDESDGTFLNHNADLKVLTNIDNDHLDFYKTTDSLNLAFKQYLFDSPQSKIIACLDDPGIFEIFKDITIPDNFLLYSSDKLKNNQISYSINNNNLTFFRNNIEYEVSIPIHGDHFLKNALACILTCEQVGVPINKSIQILKKFSGVKRRMEFKGEIFGTKIYDDYGHHPTEIRVVTETLNKIKKGRSVVVFQPHRFTRTRDHYQEFGVSLSSCDYIFILPIYSAGEDPIEGITSDLIANSIETKFKLLSGDIQTDSRVLIDFLKEGDVLLTLGAGNVNEWGEFLLKRV